MKTIYIVLIMTLTVLSVCSCSSDNSQKADAINEAESLIIRMSEIEIDPNRLEEYKLILNEEAEASMRLEPGVISIFPMQEKNNPTQIRILEIYANKDAYESHLKTPHFLKYKTTTLDMVKSLKLVDMSAMESEIMSSIFYKLYSSGTDMKQIEK